MEPLVPPLDHLFRLLQNSRVESDFLHLPVSVILLQLLLSLVGELALEYEHLLWAKLSRPRCLAAIFVCGSLRSESDTLQLFQLIYLSLDLNRLLPVA